MSKNSLDKLACQQQANQPEELAPRILELHLPFPPTSFNPMLRSHRIAQHKINKKYQQRISQYFLGIEPFDGEFYIEWEWIFYCSKKRFHQCDGENVSAPGSKLILDALVKAGIIQNDSNKFIKSPVLHWYGWYGNSPDTPHDEGESGKVLVRVSQVPLYRGQIIRLE